MGAGVEQRSFFYSASDGLRLHARIHGRDNGYLPVVCLPGLTRNARDFGMLAEMLASDGERPRRVISFDYRGRGLSARDRDWRNYDVLNEAADVVAGLIALDIEHAAFIGTSRGGLIIHALAAMRPGLMEAVVLNDIGPRIDGAGLAQIRAYLERAPKPKSLKEAIAIQRAAVGASFPALDDADWQRMVAAIYDDKDGRLEPAYDEKLLKTVTGVDLNRPLPELWPQFAGLAGVPLLVLRGENSKLLSAETLGEMATRHPDIETVTVAGQGHAPLLETGTLPGTIKAFLKRAEDRMAH
ncbi:alpha/beta hydrolase [Nitratireductor mangrovi]|uniref:Alpha/beta hydrolase n=1 Tax=Nitratireductor mangrovi TaxID=2599600 RepID=A0A5B8KTL1_9HYPH|nr:alpha/beta hydrolase [Nitratireductor mangrovi]QDY98947.1 alpha/beta hydrolase [Nitratireductor mangrovi]